MPKVPSPGHAPSHGPNLNVLKRNQACHQCRRRKLKWYGSSSQSFLHTQPKHFSDAKRPCSTCVRSHKHAIAHSPAGTVHPPEPECTFDEPLELNTGMDGPKTKYEKLENRIAELEALLQEKNTETQRLMSPPQNSSPASSHHDRDSGFGSESDTRSSGSTPALVHAAPLSLPAMPSMDVSWTHWPNDLPGPDLLRHLVDGFFTFHPHAGQLFHAPTFMTLLTLPPNHPKFPAVPVLHAICAVGASYTSAVTCAPPPDFDKISPEDIFTERYRLKENRPDSFAEQQAARAKETLQRMEILGLELLQVLQASVLLSWYYCSNARYTRHVFCQVAYIDWWSHSWAELFLNTSHSMRLSIPLGLNVCPPFHTISKSTRPASILKPAKNVIEDEMRRNVFWLAYAVERQHGCSNGWALSLDDQDISQLLPVRLDQFENGTLVSPSERQWAHSNDLLSVHPEKQTDGLILYVKATLLLSKVKTFNSRFRAKHFAGDGEGNLSYNTFRADEPVDPRNTMAFIDLDGTVTSFIATFPTHLRNPVIDGKMDCTLFAALIMSHVAMIILHEPHADIRSRGCISALKILTATRAIIDLVYTAWSTSFDLSYFESFVSFCFFVAGRILTRFLQAAVEESAEPQIKTFRHDLGVVKSAIEQMAPRHRLALHLLKMLESLTSKSDGQGQDQPQARGWSEPQSSPPSAHPLAQPLSLELVSV
ncbi:hypothetical protein D9757_002838 [Collybiopsis confluens]|uniref:Xylanolytic transcriptional activator regulatory domain-containing protein n=1 Tax=Collybiopsis confluens TaxID=2823264 RepID=A0A8H5HVZ6_9AGAR|nr:hypothetical protein D9757_002838 [Collybiopsis confluens]